MAIDLTLEWSGYYASSSSIIMNKPTNTADGDFLFAGFFLQSGRTINSVPADWNYINSLQSAFTANWRSYWYYKRASSEPSTWTWGKSGTDLSSGIVKRITGVVSSGDPFDATATTYNSGTQSATAILTAITTNTANAAVIAFMACGSTGAYGASDLTGIAVQANMIALFGDLQESPGTTGNKTINGAYSWHMGSLMALKPAGNPARTRYPFISFKG